MSPLAGRRVVVTRAAEQASPLADLLEARGARPVVVPLIAIVDEPAGMTALAELDPNDFDWVVFTSPNGASRSVAVWGDSTPAHTRVAAVGATTAAELPRVDLVPQRQLAAGLLDEFPPVADPGSDTVLVVQAVDAEPTLADGLRAKGWQVTTIAPYRSVPAVPSAGQQLAALAADAVLFASGSAVRAWVQVFGTSTPPITVAIGPQTEAAAVKAGLKMSLVAADHSLVGMIEALEGALGREG